METARENHPDILTIIMTLELLKAHNRPMRPRGAAMRIIRIIKVTIMGTANETTHPRGDHKTLKKFPVRHKEYYAW
jgi:hypothetical protein